MIALTPALVTIQRNGKPQRALFIPRDADERAIKAAARRIRRNNARAPKPTTASTTPCPEGAAVSFLAHSLASARIFPSAGVPAAAEPVAHRSACGLSLAHERN